VQPAGTFGRVSTTFLKPDDSPVENPRKAEFLNRKGTDQNEAAVVEHHIYRDVQPICKSITPVPQKLWSEISPSDDPCHHPSFTQIQSPGRLTRTASLGIMKKKKQSLLQ
jgi:hypothetical protein